MNTTLLTNQQLEKSSIVANSQMNRERNVVGSNSYEKDLHLNLINYLTEKLNQKTSLVNWLDNCCGSAKALTQVTEILNEKNLAHRVNIIGIDLVDFFYPTNKNLASLKLLATSINNYQP